MAAGNPDLEKRYSLRQKERPASAPATKHEAQDAQLSAGQTDDYVRRKERPRTTGRPRHLDAMLAAGGERPKTSPSVPGGGGASGGGGSGGAVDMEEVLMSALSTNLPSDSS